MVIVIDIVMVMGIVMGMGLVMGMGMGMVGIIIRGGAHWGGR